MTNANPWLTGPEQAPEPEPEAAHATTRRQARTGPSTPQAGVPTPDTADRLPRWSQAWPATVWWLGVHGGAGESTLATLAAGSRPAQHGWPVADTPGTPSRVALVARTSWSGLTAAQRAATEWASGVLGDSVQLVGLVLIPDAPGRLPKPLRDLQHVIAGGVPRVWTLPWVDAWRLGPGDPSVPVPKEFRALLADLQLSPSGPAHN
ncbi:MAG: hypothetical protein CMH38_14165 [Microbacterium sp.]|uniref:DUF6668 family protein n=1 Tax=Microbacterium sp. TaxID=51671 RepID=UPI000C60757C|nr:DUF6668 family protein [Microbacterium sp.]MAY51032.1 hypothetical protein [Microbacterium sp.]